MDGFTQLSTLLAGRACHFCDVHRVHHAHHACLPSQCPAKQPLCEELVVPTTIIPSHPIASAFPASDSLCRSKSYNQNIHIDIHTAYRTYKTYKHGRLFCILYAIIFIHFIGLPDSILQPLTHAPDSSTTWSHLNLTHYRLLDPNRKEQKKNISRSLRASRRYRQSQKHFRSAGRGRKTRRESEGRYSISPHTPFVPSSLNPSFIPPHSLASLLVLLSSVPTANATAPRHRHAARGTDARTNSQTSSHHDHQS